MKVAETEDLRTLATVHLRIASTMICIQHLEVFLPNLVVLDLNGSELSSLRDLGTQLRIKSLNVSRCGLHSLDGTTGLSTLVELVADENAIRGVEQVCNLIELTKLSLRGYVLVSIIFDKQHNCVALSTQEQNHHLQCGQLHVPVSQYSRTRPTRQSRHRTGRISRIHDRINARTETARWPGVLRRRHG